MTDLITPKRLAELLGVTPQCVTAWCRAGLLDAQRLDGRWVIRMDGLVEQLARIRRGRGRPPGRATPTMKQIWDGLTSPDWRVRLAWAERLDYRPTAVQVERGLTDPEWKVRLAWARRVDYTPTQEQVELGLSDQDGSVRLAWAQRTGTKRRGKP